MSSSKKVRLYVGNNCHLCDIAVLLLKEANLQFEKIDINSQEKLYKAFSVRIPVVELEDGRLLFWPFSLEQLTH